MQKAVELDCRGLTLRGMLHIPEQGKERYPFVALYHGFTGNKVEAQFMFVRMSRELEKIGIGSVRFDFSGSGESDGSFEDTRASTQIYEAGYIFEYMKGLDFADSSNLFMLGMSMGGFDASIAAAGTKGVKALVLWAPAGNMAEIAESVQNSNKLALDGMGRADIGGLLLHKDFVADFKTIDVFKRAAEYKGDVLLVHGTNDMTVPIEISRQYRKLYGQKASLVEVEGAGHVFAAMVWKNVLINSSIDFLAKHI